MFRHLAGLAARIGAGAIGSEWRVRKAAVFVLWAGDTLIAPRDIPVCAENSDSNVLVMQSTDHGMRHDASDPLNRAGDWRIFVQ